MLTPEAIAERAAAVIEAMRAKADSMRDVNRFVSSMLIKPSVLAAAVLADLRGTVNDE